MTGRKRSGRKRATEAPDSNRTDLAAITLNCPCKGDQIPRPILSEGGEQLGLQCTRCGRFEAAKPKTRKRRCKNCGGAAGHQLGCPDGRLEQLHKQIVGRAGGKNEHAG